MLDQHCGGADLPRGRRPVQRRAQILGKQPSAWGGDGGVQELGQSLRVDGWCQWPLAPETQYCLPRPPRARESCAISQETMQRAGGRTKVHPTG